MEGRTRASKSRTWRETSAGLSDPACVSDTFIEGVGLIEVVSDSSVRVTLYVYRDLGDGTSERVVVARIVAPCRMVPGAAAQILKVVLGVPFMSDMPPDTLPH